MLDAGRTRTVSDTLLGKTGGGAAPVGRLGAVDTGGGGGGGPRGLGVGTGGFPDPVFSMVEGRLGGSTEFVRARGGRDTVDVGRSATTLAGVSRRGTPSVDSAFCGS